MKAYFIDGYRVWTTPQDVTVREIRVSSKHQGREKLVTETETKKPVKTKPGRRSKYFAENQPKNWFVIDEKIIEDEKVTLAEVTKRVRDARDVLNDALGKQEDALTALGFLIRNCGKSLEENSTKEEN